MSQTAANPNASSHTPGTHSFVHVLPLRLLVTILVLLLILTFLTTEVSNLNLGGAASIIAALGIAVIKSALVVLFFMHLKYDKPFYALVFLVSLMFVAIFICAAIIDGKAYHHNLTPPSPSTVVTRQ